MKRILAFIVFILLSNISESSVKSKIAQFQEVLDSIYARNPEAVGIMAHIEAPDKEISWSGAVGLSNKKDTMTIKVNQPALITSNTKTYISASILRLVEQKKLSLDDAIGTLITAKSARVLKSDGYNLEKITIKHLLSHTGGIFNYVATKTFEARENEQPDYHWTRDEQIQLAVDEGQPLSEPQGSFAYSDTNYLLLTEIIEGITGKIFYDAIRELLNYEKHRLSATWFYSLEETPANTQQLIYQYNGKFGTDTEHPSFDLYGGGGIATTTRELAVFVQLLFTGAIFDNTETIDLIYTEVPTIDNKKTGYRLGISKSNINGTTTYGHSGFFGTNACYIPAENTSISVFISNADKQNDLLPQIQKAFLKRLKQK